MSLKWFNYVYIPIILGLYPHEIPIETVYMPHVPRPVGEAQHFRGPAKCPDGHDLTLQICGQQTQAGIDLYLAAMEVSIVMGWKWNILSKFKWMIYK